MPQHSPECVLVFGSDDAVLDRRRSEGDLALDSVKFGGGALKISDRFLGVRHACWSYGLSLPFGGASFGRERLHVLLPCDQGDLAR